jgi:hypothetical protein
MDIGRKDFGYKGNGMIMKTVERGRPWGVENTI